MASDDAERPFRRGLRGSVVLGRPVCTIGQTPTVSIVNFHWRRAHLDRDYFAWVARVLVRFGLALAGAAVGAFLAVVGPGVGSWQFWALVALGLSVTVLIDARMRLRRSRR